MSGPGPGNDVSDSTPVGRPSGTDCRALSLRATIASPVPTTLALLQRGDFVKIVLTGTAGPVVAMTNANQLLGSVFTSMLDSLINCLNNGVDFKGQITSLTGGHCELLITPL